jgi:ribosomal protein RSM22 (predicted rRNA methylase)
VAELPQVLADAIERELRAVSPRELARASSDLTARYRARDQHHGPVARSRLDTYAYAAARMPATYAAISAVFEAIREARPDWRPQSMLDLGSGPGTGLWSAATAWPSLERCTAVEAAGEMLALGQRLGQAATHPAVRGARWEQSAVIDAVFDEAYDLALLAYVLAELDAAAQASAIDRVVSATERHSGLIAVVEPGTPDGYARVLRARDRLLARNLSVVAPCPHDAPCPLPENDWCHFGVRLPRASVHRAAKAASLNYEDEKYAYVVMARTPGARAASRVLRHPQVRPRLMQLSLCTPTGVRTVAIPKSDGDRYRAARKARWGDAFPDAIGNRTADPKR